MSLFIPQGMKQAVSNAIRTDAQDIKVRVSGHLDGADMSLTEEHKEGSVPFHIFRADIDYGTFASLTTYGKIGVKK